MILHVFLNKSTFVMKDQSILEDASKTDTYHVHLVKKTQLPLALVHQLLFLLFRGWRYNIFVIQFAGYHSLLPCLFAKLTSKKSLIISGGTDCVSFPGIRYGNFYRPILKDFTRWSYLLCDAIAPKHLTLWEHDYHYDTHEPSKQGIRHFTGLNRKQVVPIENGYDTLKWSVTSTERIKNSFITVTGALEYPFQSQLKGIDMILQLAAKHPECTFTIVGVPHAEFFGKAPENTRLLPPVKNESLAELFNTQEYYMQLSMAEGFPNALCEAMLCGCTPIVSAVFSMPEIVGDAGYILTHRDTLELDRLMEKVLKSGPMDPSTVRSQISERYSIQVRAEKLRKLILSLGC